MKIGSKKFPVSRRHEDSRRFKKDSVEVFLEFRLKFRLFMKMAPFEVSMRAVEKNVFDQTDFILILGEF